MAQASVLDFVAENGVSGMRKIPCMLVLLALLAWPCTVGAQAEPQEPEDPVEAPAETPAAPAAVPEEKRAEEVQENEAPQAAQKPRASISLLVLDTLDRGAGAKLAAQATRLLKKSLMGLEHVEVLGSVGVARLRDAVPKSVHLELSKADGFVRKGQDALFNLGLEDAVDAFQTGRVFYRRHMAWLDDPERPIAALMGLAEALATSGQQDAARMAYREVLCLSPGYEPDPGQVPSKLRTLFEQVREQVAAESTGQVILAVKPKGAKIILDGLTVGESPMTVENVAPGLHMVWIHHPGHRSLRQVIEVGVGETAKVEHELQAQLIPDLVGGIEAALATDGGLDAPLELARDLSRIAGMAVVLSGVVLPEGQQVPVLSVAVIRASGRPIVLAARLITDQSSQVGGALAWQISDGLDEGSAPLPPPASLGLDFSGHLLGRLRKLAVPTVVRLPNGLLTPPGDEAYPGPTVVVTDPPAGAPGPVSPPVWSRWWFWSGVGLVVAGAIGTTLALTLKPEQQTIYEPDQIRVRVTRNPTP